MGNLDLALEQHNQRDAAKLLYERGIAGIAVSLFASSFLVISFYNPDDKFKLTWWIIITTILVVRLTHSIRWLISTSNQDFDPVKSIQRYYISLCITAVTWSYYYVMIVSTRYGPEFVSAMITLCAMTGASASALSGHKKSAIAFALILLTPTTIALFFVEYNQWRLGVLGVAYTTMIIVISKKSAEFTQRAIMLKNQNAILANEMEQKVKERTQKIYELSNLDPLTKLFNRSAFLDHLKEHLEISRSKNQSLALLFIDLDGFKKINDAIGHDTGDKVLTKTASRLRELCRDEKLICRWGGDEFLVSIPNCNDEKALNISYKIINSLSRTIEIDHERLNIGATVGVAMFPKHGQSELRLIQLADTAMYYRKKSAPSTVGIFSRELEVSLSREQRLKDKLHEAIEKNELYLVFQPIISSMDGNVFSFEALIRWKTSDEEIMPNEFIPVAEQYGLIQKIGTWVMYKACKIAKQWPEETAVSVNVSVLQLQSESFVSSVEKILLDCQLAPSRLHIEITESVFAVDKNLLFDVIHRLQKIGVSFSLDDFGAGYSSLSILQFLPVNTVKIDQSFVSGMEKNGLAVINAVMHIAQELDYQVIAEGVETPSQASKLRQIGVAYMQGLYFSKPLQETEVQPFLSSIINIKSRKSSDYASTHFS